MTRLDRYVLGQLTLLFGFFALVLVTVYWINRAVLLFDELIADGQSAATFLTFTALALPAAISLALPLAAFAATVHVTNRLTTESELVVAQAAGLSPWRLARPVVAFGLLVAALMGVLEHWLVPASRAELSEREAEIRANVTARMLTDGRFVHPAPGITVYIREITEAGELRDILLSDARDPARRTTYMAAGAWLVRDADRPVLVMRDGTAQTLTLPDRRLTATTFESFAYDVGALIGDGRPGRKKVREFPTPALLAPDPADLAAANRPPAAFRYEAHVRTAAPLAPLAVALLGFAALRVGGFSRFGVWRQIALAVSLILLVQVVESATADLARREAGLWPLVYLPTALAFAMAAGLLWLAGRPALPAALAPGRPRAAEGAAEAEAEGAP